MDECEGVPITSQQEISAQRRQAERDCGRSRHQQETTEQRARRLQADRHRRQQDTPEQREQWLQADRQRRCLTKQQETAEQREQRLQARRERDRLRRQQDTSDERRQHVDSRRMSTDSSKTFKNSLHASLDYCRACNRIVFTDKIQKMSIAQLRDVCPADALPDITGDVALCTKCNIQIVK